MNLWVIGINHRSANLALREQLAFAEEQLPQVLAQLQALPAVQEVALLSTCNRTEFYALTAAHASEIASNPVFSIEPLWQWWSQSRQLPLTQMREVAYQHQGEAAIRHLLRVASGLDSMVLGEPQILGQLKTAYRIAEQAGTLGSELHRLFQYGFSMAKQVRHDTEIGVNSVSVAANAVKLAQRIFSDLHQQRVLLVGAGQTIELVARHFISAGVQHITVANRTLTRAQNLAAELATDVVRCTPILLHDLPQHLPLADIVVSSTASQLPIIGKGMVEAALKIRKNRSLFLMDLAVPRDIEAEVAELKPVFLYTVDDLQTVISEHHQKRVEAAEIAERLTAHQAASYLLQRKEQQAASTVSRYRDKIDAILQAQHTKALQALQQGKPPEEVLQRFGHDLTRKIMHDPSLQLKHAAKHGRYELLDFAQQLLGLNDTHD
jgi:glutamyl-tRNA reductase